MTIKAERSKNRGSEVDGTTARREFLTNVAALATGLALVPGGDVRAQAARPGTDSGGVRRIDVRHHSQSPGLA